jgi:hypothetical protein
VIQINALPVAVVHDAEDGRTAAYAAMLLQMADKVPTPEVRAATSGDGIGCEKAHPNPAVTMEDYVRHIEHAVQVAGIDHVGIGCDFDGGGGFPGLNSVADYPNLTAALLARGWTEAALASSGAATSNSVGAATLFSADFLGSSRSSLPLRMDAAMKHSACAAWCSASSAARSGSFGPLKVTSGRRVTAVIASLPAAFLAMTPLASSA